MVKCPTSAWVMISGLVSSSPPSDSALTAQGLEPAWDSVSPPVSLPLPVTHTLSLSLSLSKINKHLKNLKKIIRILMIAVIYQVPANKHSI